MSTFVVVTTFKPGTDMRDVFAVVREEQAEVEVLRAADRVGSIHLSLVRGTNFIEILAACAARGLDVYPTTPPAQPGA